MWLYNKLREGYFNTDHAVRVVVKSKQVNGAYLPDEFHFYGTDGEVFGISNEDLSFMYDKVIAAQPGYETIQYNYCDGEEYILRLPIIAWAIGQDGASTVTPYTTDQKEEERPDVVMPDGRICSRYDRVYETYDEWLIDKRKYEAQRQSYLAKKAAGETGEAVTEPRYFARLCR